MRPLLLLVSLTAAMGAAPARAQVLDRASSITHGGVPIEAPRTHAPPRDAPPEAASTSWIGLPHPYAHGRAGLRVGMRDATDEERREEVVVRGLIDADVGLVFPDVGAARVLGRVRFSDDVEVGVGETLYLAGSDGWVPALGVARVTCGYALVATPALVLRLGADGLVLHDAFGVEGGAGLRADLEAYPAQPLALAATVMGGALGGAAVIEGEASVGVQADRVELRIGYRVMALFGSHDDVALHGPSLGVRVWIS